MKGHVIARPIRQEGELRDAARHVSYEIEMMIYSARFLGGWYASPPVYPVGSENNMALESFLLHFRNLRAFLCPLLQALNEKHILASDFLDEREAKNI